MKIKQEKRIKKHRKIRMRLKGTKAQPRLFVFRSNNHIYAKLIDDEHNKILLSISDKDVKVSKGKNKSEMSKEAGILIAKKAIDQKIKKIIFDRVGFIFHGRIKAFAEGAREGGLTF